jgi:hypothetical protein
MAEPVQDPSDLEVLAHLRELAHQLDRLAVRRLAVMTSRVAREGETRMHAALPVQLKLDARRRLVDVAHDLLEHRAQDPLLERSRRGRMSPQGFDIVP